MASGEHVGDFSSVAASEHPRKPAIGEPAIRTTAPNTLRAYRSDWRRFCEWARHHDLEALPADPLTIRLYLEELAVAARAPTIARRLASIAHVHRAAQRPSPTENHEVKALWADIRRRTRIPRTSAEPIRLPLLRRIVNELPGSLSGIRDRALLLVGFAGALRRSQLVALDVEDVATTPEGLHLSLCHLSDRLVIPASPEPAMCPVRAVDGWRGHAQLSAGPLFRPVDRHGRLGLGRLSSAGVNRVVKRAVARTGVDPAAFSAESLRAGLPDAPGGKT